MEKRYLYRAIDEHGRVVDVLLREHRDLASEASFRRAIPTSGKGPAHVVSDHHQPYVKAVQRTAPQARHIPTGLRRRSGDTTKSIERSHVAIEPWRTGQSTRADARGRRGHERPGHASHQERLSLRLGGR
jgi:transposase-like protein